MDSLVKVVTSDAFASALIGGLVAFLIARLQIRIKMRELENFYIELSARSESQRQAQLLEVLRSRIQCYPRLWKIIVEHTINWPYRRAKRDSAWTINFLQEIDDWNAENGVFFSDFTYQKFKEFRASLSRVARNLPEGEVITPDDYKKLYRRFIGDKKTKAKGLATSLKNDLGSYRVAAIQSARAKLRSPEILDQQHQTTEVWYDE